MGISHCGILEILDRTKSCLLRWYDCVCWVQFWWLQTRTGRHWQAEEGRPEVVNKTVEHTSLFSVARPGGIQRLSLRLCILVLLPFGPCLLSYLDHPTVMTEMPPFVLARFFFFFTTSSVPK
ncbi:hypothetical protein DAI22_04g315000 [Oryza sativa Japonica Group]|nr:hypothetical protein DAI22_04g315000 [Oryza sativa Japonica Group]